MTILINWRTIMLFIGCVGMYVIVKQIGSEVGGWLGLIVPPLFFIALFVPMYFRIKEMEKSKLKSATTNEETK